MKYKPALDVLRFCAVLLVLGRHHEAFPVWHTIGWVGVDLFFVLSGFLISGLLFDEIQLNGSINIRRFLIRRGFKIYPPFWVLLALTIPINIIFYSAYRITPRFVGAELIFLQNYLGGVWNHTWSLAIEEHFYLLLPLGLLLLIHYTGGVKHVPHIVLAVALTLLAGRAFTKWLNPQYFVAFHTHARIDSLLCGVWLSWMDHFRPGLLASFSARTRWIILPVSTALIAHAAWQEQDSVFESTVGFTLIYLGMAGFFCWMYYVWKPEAPMLAYLGRHSYSIYLWHMPVAIYGMDLLRKTILLPRHLEGFVYVLLSFAFGILMSKLVETPALRLRERLFPRKAQVAAAWFTAPKPLATPSRSIVE